ncbi:MAG TPA: hypothetical protein VD913_05350 [bacterium]|nr:hypothetical protein [bacterium]
MTQSLRNLTLVFSAGCVGGVANSLAVWGMGKSGITGAMGVQFVPDWTPAWLYPRIVWGGIWGVLFLLPLMRSSVFWRGILFSLGPTLAVLLIVLPFQAGKGYFGLELGLMTPVFALIVNAVWGICTAAWLRAVE